MVEAGRIIELNLSEKLQDPNYRQSFFLAEASAHIAEQIIVLRKRRGKNQKELAELLGTHQPAISRIEKADYQNWSFNTLRSIAGALDARIRVLIEPSEDVLNEYESDDEGLGPDTENEVSPIGAAAMAAAEASGVQPSQDGAWKWASLSTTRGARINSNEDQAPNGAERFL